MVHVPQRVHVLNAPPPSIPFDGLHRNVNTTMQWKETALRIIGEAAESPPEIQAEIVEWSSLYGTTALMMAVSRENNVDIVKALLSLG